MVVSTTWCIVCVVVAILSNCCLGSFCCLMRANLLEMSRDLSTLLATRAFVGGVVVSMGCSKGFGQYI